MRRWIAVVIAAGLLLVVYRLTLPPSLTWAHHGADGGDLVTAVVRGSIPHPPGCPTYLMLGGLFVHLPLPWREWGDPARRLNLMSAVLAAAAAALTAAAVGRLCDFGGGEQEKGGQEAGGRKQEAGSREAGSGEAGSGKQEAGSEEAGSRERETGGREQGADRARTPSLPPAPRHSKSAICNLQSPLSTLHSPVCAALCLGLAPLFWSQAIIAEAYAPAALFAALVSYLALRGGPAWALGLAWGVGLGVHPTLLFLAPLVVWGVWGGLPAQALRGFGGLFADSRGHKVPALRNSAGSIRLGSARGLGSVCGSAPFTGRRSVARRLHRRADPASENPSAPSLQAEIGRGWNLALAGLLALLGWGTMYGPVLLVRGARGGVPSPWGDVSTLAGWWVLVSGQLYHGYVFGLALAAWPQRLLALAGLLARQFTPVGAALAGLGWFHLCEERRALAGVSALSFGAFSLYAIGYDTADSLVFLVPALPLAALWLGAGLNRAAAWLERRMRWGTLLLFLLPLLQVLLFWGRIDLSGERTAMEWAERVLAQAPPRAAILTAQDAHTFTLWYVHDALGERPDVVVVDRDMWGQEPYRGMVAEELGLGGAGVDLSPEEAARLAGRPVVTITGGR